MRLLLFSSIVFININLYSLDKIYWPEVDRPPYFIMNGQYKGKGTVDLLISYLHERMPEYTHINQEINVPRFLKEAELGNPWCHPWMLKTPDRENFLYFSDPITIRFPLQLIINKENISIFGYSDSISLENGNRQFILTEA